MEKPEHWSDSYFTRVHRNIGPITLNEQEEIQNTCVGIFGLGGLGGPLAEQLMRTGCQNFIICDYDKFDESNLNRQLCTMDDLGKYKVEVLEQLLLKIDPEANIQRYDQITEKNIFKIIKKIDLAILTLDDLITSILISRECRKMDVPMLESWGIPCLWAWWFTGKSIDYEKCYNLPTRNMSIKQIKNLDQLPLQLIIPKLFQIPGVIESYDREPGVIQDLLNGTHPSPAFTPFVNITSSYLLVELICAGILKIKPMILAPRILGFDYIRMKMIDFTF